MNMMLSDKNSGNDPLADSELRKVVFLISHGLTSGKIADILHISKSAVEKRKSRINDIIGGGGISGITDYARVHGIKEDSTLLMLFKTHFQRLLSVLLSIPELYSLL